MEDKSDTLDRRIDKIAARQHGVITLRQLEALGLGRRGVSKRAKGGRLHRVHQGVYTVGHRAPSHRARFMAAVLACGEGAVLSHVSAAVLWGLLKPIDGPVHVSVPTTSGRRSRRGIRLHRCPSLKTPREPSPSPSHLHQEGGRGRRLTTRRHNIPVTTIPRTIEDLQRTEVNVKLGRWTVDFLWRRQRVVVETDYWTYHRGSVAFHDDHARDLDLRVAGYTVLRFTDLQLEKEPGRVAVDVARALEQEDWYSEG